jgi:DNA-binding PadR family transcriptional regulator
MRIRRPSPQTRAVLHRLLSSADRWCHGYELAQATGLASGTLYPILLRLAERGMLSSRWEAPRGGRPRRHLYRLTPGGVEFAAAHIDTGRARSLRRPAEAR